MISSYKGVNHETIEAVIKVMEENGGFASLSYLYEKALRVQDVIWRTKTPF